MNRDRSRTPIVQPVERRRRHLSDNLAQVAVPAATAQDLSSSVCGSINFIGGPAIADGLLTSVFPIGLYDEEPDATTCCSQLVDVHTGTYHHTHKTFLGELAAQVQSSLIGPELRKSLLMIFIQHYREQLRRLHGAQLSW